MDDYESILTKEQGAVDQSAVEAEKLMSGIVAQKLQEMKSREWELKWRGESVQIRAVVDRIVKVVEVFKDLGTPAAAFDPIHAGLPWAGVCVLLSVSHGLLSCVSSRFCFAQSCIGIGSVFLVYP